MWHDKNNASLLSAPDFIQRELFGVVSLTERIGQFGRFSVRVLSQQSAPCFLDEKQALDNFKPLVNIRTVLLLCDNNPIVFARTALPRQSTKRTLQQLTKLGDKSLGSVLHSSKQIKAGRVENAKIQQSDEIYQPIKPTLANGSPLWARRIIYHYLQSHLLVSEVFLPDYWKILKKL